MPSRRQRRPPVDPRRRRDGIDAVIESTVVPVRRDGCDGESACKRDSVGGGPLGSTTGGHPSVRPTRGLLGDLRRRAEGRPCPLLGLAPGGVYRAARVASGAGALLPHRFTLACDRSPGPSAVCFLLHLSVRSPRPGSRQHPARWSPDFPRHGHRLRCRTAATRPTHHRRDQCTARRTIGRVSSSARCRRTCWRPASGG